MQLQVRYGFASLLLGGLLGSLVLGGSAGAEIGDLTADSVLGQATFTDSSARAIGADTFGKPAGIAIDAVRDRVYVSDASNHRVLGWSNASALADGAPADLVIGQPNFSTWGCNRSLDGSNEPVTMESLCDPAGLAVDANGNLYVADTSNCRVLEFDDPFANDTTADRVLGQADGSCNGTIVNADRLFYPKAVAVDGSGNVYVADGSCRVLEFDGPLASTDTTADRVYGQPDFTTRTCSSGGVYFPQGLSIDPAGHLYVGSTSRVYEFDDPLGAPVAQPTADHTLGSSGCNSGGETSASTCFPSGVATDSSGHLFVADALNSRVLEFDSPLSVNQAARVFGQSSFGPPPGGTTFCGNQACNVGGASASSLCLHQYSGSEVSCAVYWDAAVAVDGNDDLWVADGFNNRVLRYNSPLSTDRVADLVLGQQAMATTSEPVVPLNTPAVGINAAHYQAIAVDTGNSRVMVYGNLAKYSYNSRPIGVFGQPDITSNGCNTGGVSARSLCNPTAALVQNGYLWIADTGNNRVLRFDPPWLSWDYTTKQYTIKHDADYVFGQADFTSNGCSAGSGGLCGPQGLAMDAHNNLYISDSGNNRILVDQNPLTTDNNAEVVWGQPNFDSTACKQGAPDASSVCDPRGIAVLSHIDPWGIDQGDDLYIADRGNNRVLLYQNILTKVPGSSGADKVFGQSGDMTATSCSAGADGLCQPTGVALDRGDNLLVADTGNNRVLEYDDPLDDTTADRVIGQATFADNACNRGGSSPADDTLCQPIEVVTSGAYEANVFVADSGNNRILRYESPYCIERFSLTVANRKTKGIRSKPRHTRLKINLGPSVDDDTVLIKDRLVLLEQDGSIYANKAPLFTLATDSTFSSGIVFQERVPSWISNDRATANGGVWSTGDLEADHGITDYKVKTRFYIPPGFSDSPQRDNVAYKALAVGMDLGGFTAERAWFRAQFGSTCFTTELKCRIGATAGMCSPARR